MQYINANIILSSYINTKSGSRCTNRTGLTATWLIYDMNIRNADIPGNQMSTVSEEKGMTALLEAHTGTIFSPIPRWQFTAGLHLQYLTLNGRYSIEPRVSASYDVDNRSTVAMALGMHCRMEMLNYYFTRDENGCLCNKNLDFIRALHLSLSWQRTFGDNIRLLVEPYGQYLYSVPVSTTNGSFSSLNIKDEWYLMEHLVNKGYGVNYGIDVTLEKYMFRGFYFMLIGTLCNSQYKASDGRWRNTRFNRNFIINGLIGKEWITSRKQRNVWSVNLKATYMGGDRYTPVDIEKSILMQDVVSDDTKAYSARLAPVFIGHATISFRMNRSRMSHELAFKMLNATGYAEYFSHEFNYKTQSVDIIRDGIAMPNIYYKIEF